MACSSVRTFWWLCRRDLDVCPTSPQMLQHGRGYLSAIAGWVLINILLNMSLRLSFTESWRALAAGPLWWLWTCLFQLSSGFSDHFDIGSPLFISNNCHAWAHIWWTDGIICTHGFPLSSKKDDLRWVMSSIPSILSAIVLTFWEHIFCVTVRITLNLDNVML